MPLGHDWSPGNDDYRSGYRWWTCSRCGYRALRREIPGEDEIVNVSDNDVVRDATCDERVLVQVHGA